LFQQNKSLHVLPKFSTSSWQKDVIAMLNEWHLRRFDAATTMYRYMCAFVVIIIDTVTGSHNFFNIDDHVVADFFFFFFENIDMSIL
jgi:hypothetical protein